VSIRPTEPIGLDETIVIYCDLTVNEVLTNVLWSRYNYDGSDILNLLNLNIPERYEIATNQMNDTYILSTLKISGVQSSDFATFQCQGSSFSRRNLTERRS
jgi:hypothetical protein